MSHRIKKKLVKRLDRVKFQKKGLRTYLSAEGFSEKKIEKTLKAYNKFNNKYN